MAIRVHIVYSTTGCSPRRIKPLSVSDIHFGLVGVLCNCDFEKRVLLLAIISNILCFHNEHLGTKGESIHAQTTKFQQAPIAILGRLCPDKFQATSFSIVSYWRPEYRTTFTEVSWPGYFERHIKKLTGHNTAFVR